MKKFMILVSTFLLLLALTACAGEDAVLNETKTYEVSENIHSLDIQINAADFQIEYADRFSVESNLKYLSVSERNGVLTIADEARGNCEYTDAVLILYVPNHTVFDDVEITTGAAKLTADILSANTLELKLGAGDVEFGSLQITSDADIEGGAGKITIAGGQIQDLSLEMGAGELNLCAALLGNSELFFGVGKSDITLIGSPDDYKVEAEKGIGSICVDGKDVSDFRSSGSGQNRIEIEGGIGAIDIAFMEVSA